MSASASACMTHSLHAFRRRHQFNSSRASQRNDKNSTSQDAISTFFYWLLLLPFSPHTLLRSFNIRVSDASREIIASVVWIDALADQFSTNWTEIISNEGGEHFFRGYKMSRHREMIHSAVQSSFMELVSSFKRVSASERWNAYEAH